MKTDLIAASIVGGLLAVVVTVFIMREIVILGDSDMPNVMRSEAYQAAVDFALAKSDLGRSMPSLTARDFTQERSWPTKAGYLLDTYEPCALPSSELLDHIGLPGETCTASPGVGGVQYGARCPLKSCVIVSVRDETWDEAISRQIVLSTLLDHVTVCAYASAHGPNKRTDALAAGCGRQRYQPVTLAVEVKPRLARPCVDIPEGKQYRPVCSNPRAALYLVD